MRESFYGYYPPTAEEYERLWKEAMVVLDTNVLLSLYRLPTTARDELLTVLEDLKERVWVPYQVALEFHRNRLTVISGERRAIEGVFSDARKVVEDIKGKVSGLELEKRGLMIDPEALITELNQASEKLVGAVKSAHEAQLDISATDSVRDRLDDLLQGRVGLGPATKAELDALIAAGEDRFQSKIPPGFADAEKEKNVKEAIFIHDHLEYPRKFGDLILWRQLIDHAKSVSAKYVILVTADKKEDWWRKEQGRTIGPHPELVREIRREADVELFWMYSSDQFMEHAKQYAKAQVSPESLTEIKNVALAGVLSSTRRNEIGPVPEFYSIRASSEGQSNAPTDNERQAVADWLARSGCHLHNPKTGFPTFLAWGGTFVHGYHLVYAHLRGDLTAPNLENDIIREINLKKDGEIQAFSLLVLTYNPAVIQDPYGKEYAGVWMAALRRPFLDGIIIVTLSQGGVNVLADSNAPSRFSTDLKGEK